MDTLWTESLWGDEGFSALAVQKQFHETIRVVMNDTAPPLFYVIGFIWGRIFGFSETSLRSLSLILMLGSAFFAYKLVERIGRDKAVALVAGIMAFFSPFLFPFAFEFRMYALFSFTVMGSVYFFVCRKWRGYVIFTVASLYSHHYALFTVLGQFIWYMFDEFDWKSKKTFVKQSWPFFLVGAFYLPWVYPFYLQLTRVQGAGFWLGKPRLQQVIDLLYRFFTGGVDDNRRLVVAVFLGIAVLGKRWKKIYKKWIELLFVLLLPVFASFAISHLLTPIFFDRYLLASAIGVVVLLNLGVKRRLLPFLVAVMIFYTYMSAEAFVTPKKRPFRTFAAVVKAEVGEGDFLMNYNGKAHHLWETKYYEIDAPIYTPEGELPLYVGTAQMTEEDTIDEIPQDIRRLGVISSDPVENVEIDGGWRLEKVLQVGSLKLIWYVRSSS